VSVPSLDDAFGAEKKSGPDSEVPRDQWGHPMILPPPGGEASVTSGMWAGYTPYARASGFGKQIEDDTALHAWKERQVARGMAVLYYNQELKTLPGYASGLPGDPYHEPEKDEKALKQKWNAVAERAMEAIGSNRHAARGTAIHAATEAVDNGDSLAGFPPDIRERGEAYAKFVKEYGIVAHSVEMFGVEDVHKVAGTWDRVSWVFGVRSIGDVKTSGTMDFAGIGFSVQLAEYAHMAQYDPKTGQRTPHEDDLDLENAWIIHVDRNVGGPVALHHVDITVGWRYAQVVNEVIQARRDGTKSITAVADVVLAAAVADSHAEMNAIMADVDKKKLKPIERFLLGRRWKETS
jgi:hypothetical protein